MIRKIRGNNELLCSAIEATEKAVTSSDIIRQQEYIIGIYSDKTNASIRNGATPQI